tara:strand:- start:30 stop:329 length:300 start_codon:yes stop_codon:yes gene_type:complete
MRNRNKQIRTERVIEREIREFENSKKSEQTALVCAIFGVDMAYIEGNIGKTVLLWISCMFIVGIIWWLMNLTTYSKRVKSYNLNIEDSIEELEEELEKL